MEFATITEESAKIKSWNKKIVSKDMPVFYNPLMKFNRDISILLLNSIDKEEMQIADPMAGSGIRAIRFLKELKKEKISSIYINDINFNSVELIKQNLELNNLKNIQLSQKDANLFILESQGFDYIDIDPFGSPNPFLDSAMERISREGILAVTATDTAPLCGTYPNTCKRKYFSKPLRNEHMHETGLRILIRKVQLIAMQYEKALTPIFSYYKDHYFRIFFHCDKSKTKCDEIIKNHSYFHYCKTCMSFEVSDKNEKICCKNNSEFAGPLWVGKLNDIELLKKMINENNVEQNKEFLETILKESEKNIVGFIDLHRYSQKYKTKIPKTEDTLTILRNNGFFAEKTIFNLYGIKTNINIKEFNKLIK